MVNRKRKSKYRKWIIVSIVLLFVAGSLTAYLLRPAPLPYNSETAQKGDISTYYKFSGNVETKNRQTIISDKMMQISTLNFNEGNIVQKGDVLLITTTGDQIKAKINGEIANQNIEEGAPVMAGTVLMEIVDYTNLQISIKVDEYDLPVIKVGKKANVKIGALQKELTGTVNSISKEGTTLNGVTFFTAVIDLAKDTSLKIGMSAEVTLQNEKVTGVVTLPMSAIQFDNHNVPYVQKKEKNNTIVKTEITTGINDGITVEIKNGVTVGEIIYYPKTTTTANNGFSGRMTE